MLNPSTTEVCRKNETAIRNALASVGQERVAEVINVSPSTMSRWVTSDVARVAAILAALGLKAVPTSEPTVDPEKLRSIAMLARDQLNGLIDSGWGGL